MPTDILVWHKRMKDAVAGLADKEMHQRAWLGAGPEQSSPTEDFCQFLDDLDIKEHLEKDDVGFNEVQSRKCRELLQLMQDELPHAVRKAIKPVQLLNDPRMEKIRQAAKQFLAVL